MATPVTHQVVQSHSFWGLIKDTVVPALPQIISGAAFFVIFLIVGIILRIIVCFGSKKGTGRRMVMDLIGKTLLILMIILGLIVGLGTAGFSVASLVTSLGLAGFAVSYALKDMISNLLAGAMIILNKVFKIDDVVTVSGFTGAVKNIDLRFTQLENDEKRIMVPNATLLNSISCIDHPPPAAESDKAPVDKQPSAA